MAKKSGEKRLEIDILADARKDSKKYNHENLRGLYARFSLYTKEELTVIANDKKNYSIIEQQVAVNLLMSTSTKGLEHLKYAHERAFGEAPKILEVSGLDGKPIEIEAKESVASLDDKSINALKKTLLGVIKNRK